MKLGLSQSLRPELGLRLSPQILQRIEVLQLPALDLLGLVQQELQENEALELARDAEQQEEVQEATDEEYDALLDEDTDDWRPPSGEGGVSAGEVLEATAVAPVGLAEHLSGQLDLLDLEPRVAAMARAIVAALNPRGWLEIDLDDLDPGLDPPPDHAEREHALHVVQGLDPPGVGCRDLVECLLLQLDPQAKDYPFLASLVLDHLDDIARNRVPRIVRETGRPVVDVLAGIDTISHLDPVPGRSFSSDDVPLLHPDIVVRRLGDDYEISLENDWLPALRISRSCRRMAADRRVPVELRRHIRGKIESARSLIDAVAQRKHTLFRVATELVARQPAFLEQGRAGLRPMRMQELADALGVHVSTVSRAIAGKSIQTPRGIFVLKDLFTGEVPLRSPGGGTSESGAGAGESRAAVQELVRAIIAAEDKTRPLSDEAIVERLASEHGLELARRTVTKYRKAMGLGSSRARRAWVT